MRGVENDEAPLTAFRPLKPKTIEGRLGHARWAASALVASGVPITEISSLACLVKPLGRAGAILDIAAARSDGEPSSFATHIGDVLRIIARHWAGLPDVEVKQISAWAGLLALEYKGMTPKNKRTVREVLAPECEQKLIHLSDAMFASAAKLLDEAPLTAARLAQRGLAVDLLLSKQMRLANLISLNIDRHFSYVGSRNAVELWIDVPKSEVKNDAALSFLLSEETRDKVDVYIKTYRPHLALAGCRFLFPSATSADAHITPQAMREAIKQVTRQYVGVVVTPHQFRHVASQMSLIARPGDYGSVTMMFGHRTPQTAFRAYAGIEGEMTQRQFHQLLRDRSRLLAPQSKRKARR